MAKVLKPFSTVSRRFKPGMDATADDVAPLDFTDLKAKGFIVEPPAAKPRASAES